MGFSLYIPEPTAPAEPEPGRVTTEAPTAPEPNGGTLTPPPAPLGQWLARDDAAALRGWAAANGIALQWRRVELGHVWTGTYGEISEWLEGPADDD